VAGQGYLLPVDAKLESERDLDFETVRLEFVLRQMESGRDGKVSIVMIDACRDNPLARNLARSMGVRSEAFPRGLAPVQSGAGMFVAFSTQPGNVAYDGQGRSPFAAALLRSIRTGGRGALMIDVRKDNDGSDRRPPSAVGAFRADGGISVQVAAGIPTGSSLIRLRQRRMRAAGPRSPGGGPGAPGRPAAARAGSLQTKSPALELNVRLKHDPALHVSLGNYSLMEASAPSGHLVLSQPTLLADGKVAVACADAPQWPPLLSPGCELVGLQLLRGLMSCKGAVDGEGTDFDLRPDKVSAAIAECVHVDLDGCVVGHVDVPLQIRLEELPTSSVHGATSWCRADNA
jgi:hypothetical protein